MRTPTYHIERRFFRGALLASVVLWLVVAGLRPPAALAACGSPTVVNDTSELNDAITDFNSQTDPCDFVIEFGSDIALQSHVDSINNSASGVTLTIDGAGHMLDGDYEYATFHAYYTHLTVKDLTIVDSYDNGISIEYGTLRVERSTVNGSSYDGIYALDANVVVVDSAVVSNWSRGFYMSSQDSGSTLQVINTTVANNDWSAFYLANIDTLLTHITATRNSNGLYLENGNAVVNNSVLADNGIDCESFSAVIDVNYSLVETDSDWEPCGVSDGVDGNIVGQGALLGNLGDYGGPTPTVPLLSLSGVITDVSPAVDAGSNDLSLDEGGNPLTTDQRGAGFPRTANSTVDMGAFEGTEGIVCALSNTVSDQAELEEAIRCFNLMTTAGNYTITFDADIVLTSHLDEIQNSTNGVTLLIDGAGHTLDGNNHEFETFVIDSTELVSFDRITIVDSEDDGIDGYSANIQITRSIIRGSDSDAIQMYQGDLVVSDSSLIDNYDNALDIDEEVTAYVYNTTMTGNGHSDGIAIVVYLGVLTMTHATVVENEGGLVNEGGEVTINNSILAQNDMDCALYWGNIDIYYSLVQTDSEWDPCDVADGVNGNIVGQGPQLLGLGDYGGPTPTMPPLKVTGGIVGQSPVVNAGDNDRSVDENDEPLSADQRGAGFPRVVEGTVDMGAVEGSVEITCDSFPYVVTDEMDLTEAIICYNGITAPGTYTITLGDDIDLTKPLPAIENDTAGVSLIIQGSNRTIDAQDTFSARPLTVQAGTVVTLNQATLTGGNSGEDGGGIANWGDLTLDVVYVRENTTRDDGGGIYNGFDGTMTITNSVIELNMASSPDGDGGGIANAGLMTLTDSLVDSNRAEAEDLVLGGGIFNEGKLTLLRVSMSANSIEADFYDAMGGGIANQANLLIRDSIIAGNSILVSEGAFGGGIYSEADVNEDAIEKYGVGLTIINSTISGNGIVAENYLALGGGLYAAGLDCCATLEDPAPVTIINSTIAKNSAAGDGGDVNGGGAFFRLRYDTNPLSVNIHNSILADNITNGSPGGDCIRESHSQLMFVSLHSLYTDTDDGACGLAAANPDGDGNIVGQDASLGPLASNGGLTLTHLPAGDSPAIDAGDNSLAVDENDDPLTADQRGYTPRVFNGTVDMGAVEVGAEGAASDGNIYMSVSKPGQISGGPAYGTDDILMWDGDEWTIFFDGSAALLTPNKAKHNINAFWIGDSELVMSFAQNRRFVPGISVPVDGTDLVDWNDTDGFSFLFDGSDVDLTKKTAEKIDALHVLPGSESPINGGDCVAYLLISTQGPGKVQNYSGGALKFGGEDVLGFCATQLGFDTAGYWHMVIDGSAEGMPKNATDSISLSADGSTLYLTTSKAVNLGGGVAGGHSMVYAYDIGTGEFSGPLFKAADSGLNGKVNGLHME